MKIYVASWVEYGGHGTVGIYRTREAAEKACSLHHDPDMCDVNEHELLGEQNDHTENIIKEIRQ